MIKNFDQFISENYIGKDSIFDFNRGKKPKFLEKRRRKFLMAQEMEKRGVDPELIRLASGWFYGMDKKWRYEISNINLKIKTYTYKDMNKKFFVDDNGNIKIKLGNLIENTSLFKEYPFFINKEVLLIQTGERGKGHFNPKNSNIIIEGVSNILYQIKSEEKTLKNLRDNKNTESIRKMILDRIEYLKTESPFFILYDEDIFVLLHEIQHLIQKIEGFARGGSAKEFSDDIDSSLTPSEKYRLLAGEIESNDVAYRQKYPKNGGYGIYYLDEMTKDRDDPHRGLYKKFDTEQEAMMALQDLYHDYHKGKKYVNDKGKKYPIDRLCVSKIISRSSEKPYNTFSGNKEDVIVKGWNDK